MLRKIVAMRRSISPWKGVNLLYTPLTKHPAHSVTSCLTDPELLAESFRGPDRLPGFVADAVEEEVMEAVGAVGGPALGEVGEVARVEALVRRDERHVVVCAHGYH